MTSLSNLYSLSHRYTPTHTAWMTPEHHGSKSIRKATCPPYRPLAHATSSHQTARRPGFRRERQTGDHIVTDDLRFPPMLIAVSAAAHPLPMRLDRFHLPHSGASINSIGRHRHQRLYPLDMLRFCL